MTLNIHVMFNNEMNSFILSRFSSKKLQRQFTLHSGREALCFNRNHPRKTLKVKTWQLINTVQLLQDCVVPAVLTFKMSNQYCSYSVLVSACDEDDKTGVLRYIYNSQIYI